MNNVPVIKIGIVAVLATVSTSSPTLQASTSSAGNTTVASTR